MLKRYRKIEEDRGQYFVYGTSVAKLTSFIYIYLLLTPSIYKACRTLII